MRIFIMLAIFWAAATMASAQTVVYEHQIFDGEKTVYFVRVATPYFNGYAVSPKNDGMSINLQIGYPIKENWKLLSHLSGLSLGAGVEGINSFQNFSFGLWGKKNFLSEEILVSPGSLEETQSIPMETLF